MHQADEALAMEMSGLLHLSEQGPFLDAVGLLIAGLHATKVAVPYVDGHALFDGHGSLQ